MLWSRTEPEFVLSALDRLVDREPDSAVEPGPGWVGPLQQVKESVLANLMWLLNSRRCLVDVPPGRNHLAQSLLAFGLPDFSHLSMETADEKEMLRSAIESVIRRFEPRLVQVEVSSPEIAAAGRHLRFHVNAILNVKPAPEVVTFDSVLLLPSRSFELRGSA